MKYKVLCLALLAPSFAFAQSAIDAYNLSQSQIRGTARFMAMGGAFTALGGDLSTLNQNPAGIGVYRRSEIGATLDISPSSFSTRTTSNKMSTDRTPVACNNFGYIGTVLLDNGSFSWGASYNRVASFDRTYNAYNAVTSSSLSNYIAAFSGGYSEDELNFGDKYDNPYYDSDCDWLSILGYNSYMINPAFNGYQGLFQNGTQGDALTQVREKGYVDEYAIDFGGNVNDVFYWGIGFGVTDLSFKQTAYYSESMANASIIDNQTGGVTTGDAGFELENSRSITGSGWNFKAGVILRPINELRIGIAVHTPTWYSLTSSQIATNNYSYYNPNLPESSENPFSGSEYTDESWYDFRINTPWKIMVGAAAVLDNKAIISLDYERQSFSDMKVKYQDYWGDYITDDAVGDDINTYFKASNIIRLGLEYRLTSRFSLRAGYNYTTTNVEDNVADGNVEVLTAGTNPAYILNKDTYAVSAGFGYRYQAFYFDAAYVYRNAKSTYHAYTNFNDEVAPTADLTQTTNSIVFSMGFRF